MELEGTSMKTIVVYKSKTGFTKKYAEWIQEATKFDIANYDNASKASLSAYDLIVFGSRIHAGKIDGLKKIKELLPDHARLVVYATGATPIEAEDVIRAIMKASFTEEELLAIPHFYMPAGLNYENMNIGDKLIMKALAKMLGNKKDKSSVEAGCEQAIGHSYDISSREYIVPLLDYIQTLVKIA